ncbi:MAG: membrane protein insertase YidC [Myxococcales bacterium]|nr:membrane protein insertase YidC [Myxococcales bacterium]
MESRDSQRRLLLALALSFLATLFYTQFIARPHPEREAVALADAGPEPVAKADAGAPLPLALAPLPDVGVTPAPVERPPEKKVGAEAQGVHLAFTSEGAGLVKAELQGKKMREQQRMALVDGLRRMTGADIPPPPQMDMATPVPGNPLPLAVSIGGPQPFPSDAPYLVEEGERRVAFRARHGSWEVKKTLEWSEPGFEMSYLVEVRNVGSASAGGELGVHYALAVDPELEQKPSFFGAVGNLSGGICYARVEKEPEVFRLLPQDEPVTEEKKGAVHFFGVDQQYFLAALYPVEGPREGRCLLKATATSRTTDTYFPLSVAPGETARFRFGVFIGPKDDGLLAAVRAPSFGGGAAAATGYSPQLDKAIDLGWWAVIAKLLLPVMKFFHGIFGNWGVAIILLTLVVKIVLLPLTHRSMVSAEQLKKLQPRMEEIRKKFADDRERQNVEMMKLYQEAKVNPLGGCLPILPQLPIWGGLIAALRTSYDLYNEPFISPLWTDLTYKDPAYLLPIALGVTMIITQRMQPAMLDKSQQFMMAWVMPIFFTAIMLQYPAGLSLYIFTNNILSIAQQKLLRKYLERKGVAAPREPAKKPDRKSDKREKKPEKKMKEREA